jgi:hypothetical protein
MNKMLHALVLVFFGSACWFLSMMLKLPLMVRPAGVALPAFTRLCMGVWPLLFAGLALAAAVYCTYVCMRKAESHATWIGFLATTMSALVLVILPTVVVLYLPLVAFINMSTVH